MSRPLVTMFITPVLSRNPSLNISSTAHILIAVPKSSVRHKGTENLQATILKFFNNIMKIQQYHLHPPNRSVQQSVSSCVLSPVACCCGRAFSPPAAET